MKPIYDKLLLVLMKERLVKVKARRRWWGGGQPWFRLQS